MIAAYALAALLPLASATWVGYKISPAANSSMCIKPDSTDNGATLVLAECDDTTVFKYSNVNGKLKIGNACMDVRDGDEKNGTLAQTWECHKCNKNQTFDFVPPSAEDGATAKEGEDKPFHIKWTYAAYCLDLIDGKTEVGSKIQIWGCLDYNDNQKWTVVAADGGDAKPKAERSIEELSAHARRMHARRNRHH